MKKCNGCDSSVSGRGRRYCDRCRVKTCPGCQAQFTPENGNMRQVCCSLACAAKVDPERTERINRCRGLKPRTYHLRHRDKHGSAADVVWRKAVFARDNYTCQNCGARGCRIQAHHIKAYKTYPELRHELSNGLALCIPCHKQTDTFGWQNYWRNEIAAKRLSQEVFDFGGCLK